MATRILLADDSITIQKVVELTFSEGDFEVMSVSNGRSALEKLPEWAPDIALLDVIMPERSGYEVCHEIRQDPRFRNLPVLLLTGTFEPFDGERAKAAGASGHITKPFESRTLIARVEELLRAARPDAPAAAAAAADAAGGPAREADGEAPDWLAGDFGQDLPTAADLERGFGSGSAVRAGAEDPAGGLPRAGAPGPSGFSGLGGEPSAPAPPPDSPPAPRAEADFGRTMAIEIPVEPPLPLREPEPLRRPAMPPSASRTDFDPEADRPAPSPDPVAPATVRPARPAAAGGPALSPESIDTIARRVVEKLSDQVVREIAWEVVPDLAETLIRKRIQELEEQIGEG